MSGLREYPKPLELTDAITRNYATWRCVIWKAPYPTGVTEGGFNDEPNDCGGACGTGRYRADDAGDEGYGLTVWGAVIWDYYQPPASFAQSPNIRRAEPR